MATNKTPAEQLQPFLEKIIEISINDAGVLRFDKAHPQQLYAVCSYGSILEIAAGVRALSAGGQFTSVPILLRTLLDAYASFRCCIDDPNHFKAMYASFTNEKLRLLRNIVANPENPYLKKLAESLDVDKEQAALQAELAELKKQNYEPLKPWQEFSKASLSSEYQSLYWQLCMHAHNNVSVLEDRHLDKHGDDYQVAFFKQEKADDLVRYFDSVCAILIDASRSLHSKLESLAAKNYEALQGELSAIRKEYA